MCLGLTAMGVSMLFIPSAPGANIAGAALLIAQQISGDGMFTIFDINAVSLRQAIVQERMLGRVNAFMRMLEISFTLVGVLLGGVLGEWIGLRSAMFLSAFLVIAAGIVLFFSPARRVREAPAVTVGPEAVLSMEGGAPQPPAYP
jgi:phosphatidylglycerophosphate synthase